MTTRQSVSTNPLPARRPVLTQIIFHIHAHTHSNRYTDGDEEDIPLSNLPQYLVKPLPPLPESELQRPRDKEKEKEKRKVRGRVSAWK